LGDDDVRILLVAMVASAIAYLAFNGDQLGIGTTDIGVLMANSGRFDGKIVTVKGTVVASAGVFGIGGFRLTDGKKRDSGGEQAWRSSSRNQALRSRNFQTGIRDERRKRWGNSAELPISIFRHSAPHER
jgi:hypothetical protein